MCRDVAILCKTSYAVSTNKVQNKLHNSLAVVLGLVADLVIQIIGRLEFKDVGTPLNLRQEQSSYRRRELTSIAL